MGIFKKQTKQETIIYTIVWILLLAAPLVDMLFHYDSKDISISIIKHSLTDIWGSILSFLVVFIIHNHVIAPMLIKYKKMYQYIIGCIALVALFQLGHCMHKPSMGAKYNPHAVEMPPPPPPHFTESHPRPPIDKHDVTVFIIVIMMLGANLGVKYYFLSEEEKKRISKLKEQSLKQELDYLRYQINPHFIMNTLNNIHALVDIDPEQAKDSIVDMSRMMRYLLYESDKQYVSLHNAVIFLNKYLNLMKLRYTDLVDVKVDVPEAVHEDVMVVPLVFIPFVENAFKHGVAYDKPSVIEIDIEKKKERLIFHCRNTKNNVKHEFGGVGLNNVTKRLELIYGNDYSLDIKDEDDTYDVTLNLPARSNADFEQTPTKATDTY